MNDWQNSENRSNPIPVIEATEAEERIEEGTISAGCPGMSRWKWKMMSQSVTPVRLRRKGRGRGKIKSEECRSRARTGMSRSSTRCPVIDFRLHSIEWYTDASRSTVLARRCERGEEIQCGIERGTLLIYLFPSARILARLGDRRTSSKGLVSLKQDSHTSFTTLFAISSDLQEGLLRIDNIARRLTQF